MTWLPVRRVALIAFAGFHLAVLLAPFLSPYEPEEQNRMAALAPPMRVHIFYRGGRPARPFVYQWRAHPGGLHEYEEDRDAKFPVRFFVRGRLFGVDEPGRIFLLGTDLYGRDQLSRLLYGGRISLFAAFLAASLALVSGTAAGSIAGYFGWFADGLIMRLADVFLAVPWFYLLLAVRAVLPLRIDSVTVFLVLIAALGLAGWARPARLVRGVVLSARERDYVLAARGFGAGDLYILRLHILPEVAGVGAAQAALLLPRFLLAEVTLSYLGLGIAEPQPSWGNMLAGIQHSFVLQFCWWLLAPAAVLTAVLFGYGRLISWSAFGNSRI